MRTPRLTSAYCAPKAAAFRAVFRQFVLLCRRLDLYGRELLAVDGTRINAVNNKDRNFTRSSLREFIRAAFSRRTRKAVIPKNAMADGRRQQPGSPPTEAHSGRPSRLAS
jgi:hypothetical protein